MPTSTVSDRLPGSTELAPAPDAVALSWLVMVRWAGFAAEVGAVFVGWRGLGVSSTLALPAAAILLSALSNLWLSYRVRRAPPTSLAAGGWLVCADVVILSGLLYDSGGVLNSVSIFYLVHIVLAALVLGRTWTWIVTTLSIAGYGVLFLSPSQDLSAARAMHPEIAMHLRGMWMAFAATALIVALLVARLATLVERRDRALAEARDRRARDARLVSLVTLAAGAAHELSTPLGTIAVAARELERALGNGPAGGADHRDDVRLIRAEIDRCRRILNDMAGRFGDPVGDAPVASTLARLRDATLALLAQTDRDRVDAAGGDAPIVWPIGAVARALANLLRNGLQASAPDGRVAFDAAARGRHIAITIADRGHGMNAAVQARAGEPFYTTKPEGSGMGLGLFVATSTIEQLGGTLRIVSAEREGTTVTVTTPADVSRPDRQP
jgi:two-component system sensor histidine kinase RegB